MKVENLVSQLNMQTVCDHYIERSQTHRELRQHFEDGSVEEYVNLALGISNPAGNYSASEHRHGGRILHSNNSEDVFDLATEIVGCPSPSHLPKLIYNQGLSYLKISIGTEMAMMLKPETHWVGNKRTIWCHLLIKHHGNRSRANEELIAYYDRDRDSEMDYEIWRYIYLAMEPNMKNLGEIATTVATNQGYVPGELQYLWPDAVATFLFDNFANAR